MKHLDKAPASDLFSAIILVRFILPYIMSAKFTVAPSALQKQISSRQSNV